MALPFELRCFYELFSLSSVDIDCSVGVSHGQLFAVVIILIVGLHRVQVTMEPEVSILMLKLAGAFCSVLPRM
jgi:hypothetical protein